MNRSYLSEEEDVINITRNRKAGKDFIIYI